MILLVANLKWHQMSDPLGGLRGMLFFSGPLGGGLDFGFGSPPGVVLLEEEPVTAIDGPASGSFGLRTTCLLLFIIRITIL
jgi:hypothetical protein